MAAREDRGAGSTQSSALEALDRHDEHIAGSLIAAITVRRLLPNDRGTGAANERQSLRAGVTRGRTQHSLRDMLRVRLGPQDQAWQVA